MVLLLSAEQQAQIAAHGEKAYPYEGCGVLLGTVKTVEGGQGTGKGGAIAEASSEVTVTVMEVHAVKNGWITESNDQFDVVPGAQETAERRFTIDPRDLLRLQRDGRDRGFDIIGIYHSHPNHPAVPSDFDRTYAWAHYSYPIVAVHQGKAVDLRSWRLDKSGQFQPELIQPTPIQSVPSFSSVPPNE